jgi:hypothetical protein
MRMPNPGVVISTEEIDPRHHHCQVLAITSSIFLQLFKKPLFLLDWINPGEPRILVLYGPWHFFLLSWLYLPHLLLLKWVVVKYKLEEQVLAALGGRWPLLQAASRFTGLCWCGAVRYSNLWRTNKRHHHHGVGGRGGGCGGGCGPSRCGARGPCARSDAGGPGVRRGGAPRVHARAVQMAEVLEQVPLAVRQGAVDRPSPPDAGGRCSPRVLTEKPKVKRVYPSTSAVHESDEKRKRRRSATLAAASKGVALPPTVCNREVRLSHVCSQGSRVSAVAASV